MQLSSTVERPNYGDNKVSGCQGLAGGEGIHRWNTEDFQGHENILHDTLMVDMCQCKFVQTHTIYSTKSETGSRDLEREW